MKLDELRSLYRQSEVFRLPGGVELDAAGALFDSMIGGRAPDEAEAARAGLEPALAEGFAAVADWADDPAGRGLYAVRPGGLPLLLSAPHQFRDLHTGRIAALLMEEMEVRGLAVNTAPRDLKVEGRGGLSDLADLDLTHFNAFHVAFLRAHPAGRVVQLHGFAQEKRRTEAGRRADVILSSGSADPGEGVPRIAACLSAMGLTALVFPREVEELGGTTNATLAALRLAGAPNGSFVHVEMSVATRERLRKDTDARFVFGNCLGAGL